MKLNVKINGKKFDLEVNPNAMLIDVLRDAGFKSVKNGCSEPRTVTLKMVVRPRAEYQHR